MDLFTPLASEEALRETKLYFYDLNAKMNFTLGEKDRLYFSGYFGRDVFDNDFAGMQFGNGTFTARWNHLFSQKIFSNLSLISSDYNYELGFASTESKEYTWKYDMEEKGVKYDLGFLISPEYEVKTGSSGLSTRCTRELFRPRMTHTIRISFRRKNRPKARHTFRPNKKSARNLRCATAFAGRCLPTGALILFLCTTSNTKKRDKKLTGTTTISTGKTE
jgi:hypothetical protein